MTTATIPPAVVVKGSKEGLHVLAASVLVFVLFHFWLPGFVSDLKASNEAAKAERAAAKADHDKGGGAHGRHGAVAEADPYTAGESGKPGRRNLSDLGDLEARARAGDVSAQMGMGDALTKAGRQGQAFHWYVMAAMAEHGPAMMSVAKQYEHGNDEVRASNARAYAWFYLAAMYHVPEADLSVHALEHALTRREEHEAKSHLDFLLKQIQKRRDH